MSHGPNSTVVTEHQVLTLMVDKSTRTFQVVASAVVGANDVNVLQRLLDKMLVDGTLTMERRRRGRYYVITDVGVKRFAELEGVERTVVNKKPAPAEPPEVDEMNDDETPSLVTGDDVPPPKIVRHSVVSESVEITLEQLREIIRKAGIEVPDDCDFYVKHGKGQVPMTSIEISWEHEHEEELCSG